MRLPRILDAGIPSFSPVGRGYLGWGLDRCETLPTYHRHHFRRVCFKNQKVTVLLYSLPSCAATWLTLNGLGKNTQSRPAEVFRLIFGILDNQRPDAVGPHANAVDSRENAGVGRLFAHPQV